MTRKGTKPNKRGEKILTVKRIEDGAVSRVAETHARELVGSGKYEFCPKSEYKDK